MHEDRQARRNSTLHSTEKQGRKENDEGGMIKAI
jgi:hypothetical protein